MMDLRLLDQAIATFESQADNSQSLGRALVRRATANFEIGQIPQSLADSRRALGTDRSSRRPDDCGRSHELAWDELYRLE